MTDRRPSRALISLATFAVVLSVVAAGAAVAVPAEGSGAPTHAVGADPLRSITVVDVAPADSPNRSGVHPVEPGSTLVVRGTTNRRPGDNAIDVTVTDGPDADRFGFAVVESWGYDGNWTARLAVPADITPGMYTLSVQVDGESDVQTFEVAERRPAAIDRASLSDAGRVVAGESVPPGHVAVENVTLPDGGYVEIRDAGVLVGRSPYLAPGVHAVVAVTVENIDAGSDLRAAAVNGTADSVGDPYRRNGTAVAVPVSLPPAGPAPTATATPTATPTPSSPPTATVATTPETTTEVGPGFGVVAVVVAFVALVVAPLVGRF